MTSTAGFSISWAERMIELDGNDYDYDDNNHDNNDDHDGDK